MFTTGAFKSHSNINRERRLADESLLSLISPADLASFNQTVTQSDPFMIAGNSLAQWNPSYSFMNAQESGLTSFGKAFAQGLLQNYAQNNASNQLSSVLNVLPQLSSDPMGTAAPEGIDSSAFNMLRGSAFLNKVKRDEINKANTQSTVSDLLKTILGEGVKGGILSPSAALDAAKTGKLPETEVVDPLQNPNSPRYKTNQDKIANERQFSTDFIKDPIVADFKYREMGLKALEQAYKDKSGTSDFEMIRRAAQAVEPKLAVRADDENSLQGAASVLGMTTSAIKSAISGESRLSPEVRSGLMRIAKRGYESSLPDYNSIRETYIERAKNAGLDPALAIPYKAGSAFQDIFPDLNIDGSQNAAGSTSPEDATIINKLSLIAQKAATGTPLTAGERAFYEEVKKSRAK